MAAVLAKVNSGLGKAGLPPINTHNVVYFYTPVKGCVAYSVLSIQVFNPELFGNFKFLLVPQYISLTNACLLNTLVGAGLYLYSRPHLSRAAPREKVVFCTFGSVMFNLGSMLVWALGRTAVPECPAVRTAVGAAGALGALYLGRRYVTYLDSLVKSTEN